jgi:uncharacterized protein YyaL (SSP411 family)
MAIFTLERMVRGGINDQLRGGFCRYSVDDHWMIPHFEKMLYDNGPLLVLCCDAWQITGDDLFRDAATATADWVMHRDAVARGRLLQQLDADSEGEEGRFYVWDRMRWPRCWMPPSTRFIAPLYGLDQPPNFEGKWHLHGYRTLADRGKRAAAGRLSRRGRCSCRQGQAAGRAPSAVCARAATRRS